MMSRATLPPPHIIQQYDMRPGDEAIQPFDKLRILHGNALNPPPPPESFDFILTNPPFGVNIEKGQACHFGCAQYRLERSRKASPALKKTKKSEFLFTDLVVKSVKPRSQAAIIVPRGMLDNGQITPKAIRRELVEDNRLEAVIALPPDVFERQPRPKHRNKKSKNGIQTNILIFTKGGQTDAVFFCVVEAATPESLDALRRMFQGEAVEAPNIAAWSASREAVAENDYNLVPTRYEPYEFPAYDGPSLAEIWADIELAEEEIDRVQAGLREMLAETSGFDEEVKRLKEERRSGSSDSPAQLEDESRQAMNSLRETMVGIVDLDEVEQIKEQKRLEHQ